MNIPRGWKMYVIFIRDKRQQIYSKICVADKIEAFRKFEETIYRKELYGRKLIAVITHESKVKAFHGFKNEKCDKKIKATLKNLQSILSIQPDQ